MPKHHDKQTGKEPFMNYDLDRAIKLNEESEHESRYSWSLQEFDNDGNKVGLDQIPWERSLSFAASELRYFRSIEIEKKNRAGEDNASLQTKKLEGISANLYPGVCQDGSRLENGPSYSMFGTNRKIKRFTLHINKTEDYVDECTVLGFVRFTTELDFQTENTNDVLEIFLGLSPEQFNNIADQINSQQLDTLQIHLAKASGFYADWPPSTGTTAIKILTASSDHKVIIAKGCKIDPPRLGHVGRFLMILTQRQKLGPKQDPGAIDTDRIPDETSNL